MKISFNTCEFLCGLPYIFFLKYVQKYIVFISESYYTKYTHEIYPFNFHEKIKIMPVF